MKKQFTELGQPVISVDSKKKEIIGRRSTPVDNFKNPGRRYGKGEDRVLNNDFRSMAVGMANSYGIYDSIANTGTVVVGVSYDTPEFAVESIGLWLT